MSNNAVESSISRQDAIPLFQSGADWEKFLLGGWAGQGESHRWTVGEHADMAMSIVGLMGRDLLLRIECAGFLAGGMIEHQSVEVLVNGSKVASWMARRLAWHEVIVPNGLIVNGDMQVSLLIGNPAAPVDYGMSKDTRKLGVRVQAMEILPIGNTGESEPAAGLSVDGHNRMKLGKRVHQPINPQNDEVQASEAVVKHNAIWIASYPKSGNTWIHSVLRFAGRDYGFPQVDMDAYNILSKDARPTVCPAVKQQFTGLPCVALKTHAAYKKNEQLHCFTGAELVNAGYVHIYRNPLDVLLSYLNFTKLEYKAQASSARYRKTLFEDMLGLGRQYEYEDWLEIKLDAIPQNNLDHALDYFSDNGLALNTFTGMSGSWAEHTQSWFDAARDIPGHSIRYEDCLEDPEQFVKLCDLFRFDRSDVLSALDYVNSRARSMSTGGTKDQSVFYNKMSAYYFKDYFSGEAIERFLVRHESLLKDSGYASIFNHV